MIFHKSLVQIVLASTRQNRRGRNVADLVLERAANRTDARFEILDLQEWRLPFVDQDPEWDSKPWQEKISSADGFIFAIPEYNHGYSGAIKNALDSAKDEWFYKPVCFVSYGGASGGIRAQEQLLPIVVALRLIPVAGSVNIFSISNAFDARGKILDKAYERRIDTMLDQIIFWSARFTVIRQEAQSFFASVERKSS